MCKEDRAVPLYISIKKDIKQRIFEGLWTSGMKLPASRSLSQHYRCSVNTVERALTELAQEGYVERRERSGTFVSPKEKWGMPVNSGSLKAIGAIMVDIRNGIWSSLVQGIEDYASRKSFSVVLCNSYNNYEKTHTYIAELADKNIDGIILSPVSTNDYEDANARLIDFMERLEIPYVLVDRYVETRNTSYVISDNVQASYDITRYLLERGHRSIVFVHAEHATSDRQRFEGYCKALRDYGLEGMIRKVFVELSQDPEGASRNMIEALRLQLESLNFTAVFADNDLLAKCVYHAVRSLGKDVPDDVSVVTFDRTDESRDIPLEFTTVVQPNYDMGRIACKILLDCIEEGDMGIHKVTLPVSFWEGGSVKGVK